MQFDGTFTLDGATADEVWLALSDPQLVWHSLPGCLFLVEIDEDEPDFDALREEYGATDPDLTSDPETIQARAFEEGSRYAAILELSVGSVSPTFRTTVTIDERDDPRMDASGEGSAGNSSFEMRSWMELDEHEDGVDVDWHAEADVFGRIAQMGQRMINPVANRVVKRFFSNVQETLDELATEEATTDADAGGGAETDDAADVDGGAGGDAETNDAADVDGDTEPEAEADAGTAVDAGDESEADEDRRQGGGILARIKRLLGIGG
jgi:carbon monoxide dehydrogenase subunit G